MSTRDELDDDYVAKLLAEDAEKTSQKYSNGVSAFFSKRRAADAPKPNTRFLSHIVREADHHNATLKRKEVQEAQRRLRALRAQDEPPRKRRRADETDDGKKKRMLKDILAAAGVDRVQRSQGQRKQDHSRSRPVAETDDRREREVRHQQRGREHHHARRRKRDSLSSSDSDNFEKRYQKRKRETSRDSGSRPRQKSQEREHDKSEPGQSCSIVDNDLTIVHKRGRGALRQRADTSDRFAKDYDPSQDICLDSDEDADDWDLALEAMRDRAKYRKNQAGRMREAGFEEKDIAKFEQSLLKHESDGDARDVRWAKKGEPREWDAGKIEQE